MAYIDDEIDLDEDFGETEVPDFRDYTLRLDPSKTAGKDFVVARFQSEVPELPDTVGRFGMLKNEQPVSHPLFLPLMRNKR